MEPNETPKRSFGPPVRLADDSSRQRREDAKRQKKNAGWQIRHEKQLGAKLFVEEKTQFPQLTPNQHWTPIPMACDGPQAVRSAFWEVVPQTARVRNAHETEEFSKLFGYFIALRTNLCHPNARRIFSITPETQIALQRDWMLPVIEARALMHYGRIEPENLYPLPVRIKIGKETHSICEMDGDVKRLENGDWVPVPPGGVVIDEEDFSGIAQRCTRIVNNLVLRRRDLVTEVNIGLKNIAADRSALVSHRENVSWSRFPCTSDQIGVGTAFGWGIFVDHIGVRLPDYVALWRTDISRPSAISTVVDYMTRNS